MSTQTTKKALIKVIPAYQLFDDQYLSGVIEQLLELYEKSVAQGMFDLVCEVHDAEDICFYATRPETPEEEAQRLQHQAVSEAEELELLAKLQAKYSQLPKGSD